MGNVVHALQTKHYHVVHGVELPRDPTSSEDTGFAVQGSSRDFFTLPELDYEPWRHVVHTFCGRYSPGDIGPETFAGRVRARRRAGSDMTKAEQCREYRRRSISSPPPRKKDEPPKLN